MRALLGLMLYFTAIGLSAAAPPAAPAVAAADKFEPRAIAATLATRLQSDFVYPEQGEQYAAALRRNAEAGRYDGLVGVALADKLTEDLQSVARDGHLRVFYGEQGPGRGPPPKEHRPPSPAGGAPGAPPPGIAPSVGPPVIEHAGWIAPGIAFIRFNLFPGGPRATEAARAFMATHAEAKTIIFDIRTHRGGGIDEMDAIFPWLFAKPTRLVAMATRKSVDEGGGSPMGGESSLRRVNADLNFATREHWATPGNDRRLRKAQVYVLTSPRTGSAAEHFAFAFKLTKRGVLIGDATAGANHFGGVEDLGGAFSAFIPVGRTYDPATGKDWEGVGVSPDIAVKPEDALVKALTLSGVAAEEAAKISAKVAPHTPMERRR